MADALTEDAPLDGLLGNLRDLIRDARRTALRAVDALQVRTCWEIGRHIVEFEQSGAARAAYGKRLIPRLAESLTAEFGSGFDASNLRYMRLFYSAFPNRDSLRHELSWTHYRSLSRIEDATARRWYMDEAAHQNWNTRDLDRQIGTLYYERLLASQDRTSVEQEARDKTERTPRAFVRDKAGELTHQDIGQMDMYVRMYDDLKRGEGDNPTVGIILCADKDASVVRYSVLHENEQLFATRYRLVLPSEQELLAELKQAQ